MIIQENALPAELFIRAKVNELDMVSIIHLGLERIPHSSAIYGGTCPICKSRRSFFVWLDRRRQYRCFECGIKGKLKE